MDAYLWRRSGMGNESWVCWMRRLLQLQRNREYRTEANERANILEYCVHFEWHKDDSHSLLSKWVRMRKRMRKWMNDEKGIGEDYIMAQEKRVVKWIRSGKEPGLRMEYRKLNVYMKDELTCTGTRLLKKKKKKPTNVPEMYIWCDNRNEDPSQWQQKIYCSP